MAFTDEIQIRIDALFNDRGIKEARERFQKLQQVSSRTGLGVNDLQNRMEGLGLALNKNNQFYDQSTGRLVANRTAIQELQTQYGAMAGVANKMNRPIRAVAESLDQSRMRLTQNAQGAAMFQDRFTGAMQNNRQASKRTRRATAEFRMEMLSLMFGFMALRRVMTGMMRPALKAAGVFSTWGSMMEVLFLPIAIEIQKLLLGLFDVIAGLSRPVKMAIGIFFVLATVLLTVGLIATQVGLAVTSMGITWGSVTTFMSGAAATLSGAVTGMGAAIMGTMSTLASGVAAAAGAVAGALTLPIIAAIAVVVGAVILLNEAWANNTGNIRKHIGDLAIAIADIAPEIGEVLQNSMLAPLNMVIQAINAITGKDIDTVKEMFKSGGEQLRKFGEEWKKQSEEIGGGRGEGFLGFSLTGKGGLLEGGIGGFTSGIGDAMSGMFNFGGPGNIKSPQFAGSNITQNNIRQDIRVERGSGKKSDFAFSRELGRELEKANKNALSKQGGTSV